MSYIMVGVAVLAFIVIAFWRMHPVLFMFAGGMALISACYMADIVSGGVTDNLSISASLSMIGLGLTLIAFAFLTTFRSKE